MELALNSKKYFLMNERLFPGVYQNCKKRMEILHNSVSLIKIFPFLRPKLWAHWTNFGSPLNFVSWAHCANLLYTSLNFVDALHEVCERIAEKIGSQVQHFLNDAFTKFAHFPKKKMEFAHKICATRSKNLRTALTKFSNAITKFVQYGNN